MQIALQLLQQNGGVGGMLDKFRQGGYADQADSWQGTGPNLPISADALQEVLGSGAVGQIAQQLGLSHGDAAGGLAQTLPQIIDKFTPQGEVPAERQRYGGAGAGDPDEVEDGLTPGPAQAGRRLRRPRSDAWWPRPAGPFVSTPARGAERCGGRAPSRRSTLSIPLSRERLGPAHAPHRRAPRHRRGPDRVPAGLLHRAPDRRRLALGYTGDQAQDLRDRDPGRRDPRRVLGVPGEARRGAARAVHRPARRSASRSTSASRSCRPPCSASRSARRSRRTSSRPFRWRARSSSAPS